MASWILRYSLGLLALLAAQWASAVGLGEIQLQSAMNEPLRAEIALINIGDLNESQIAAKLASPEDFNQAGIEREFQLTDIRFKVDLSNHTHPVIRVSSQRPMKEPYLNFLLELRWTSGRLLREYTLLMDLPVFAGAPPAGKTGAAVPSTAAVRPRSEPLASEPLRRSQARSAARASAPVSAAADGSYRVQAGDTLWSIASRNQPPGVTVQQAMEAIRAANPDAFIRANPNLIRRDAVLTLPDAAAMAAVDHRLASSRLRTAQPVSDPVIESRARAAEKPVSGDESGELRLSGGARSANATSGAAGVGGRQSGSGSEAAHADIGTLLEENDRIERENAELKARVASLEEQVKTASRLAEISAPALAALQNGEPKVLDTAAADTGKPAGQVDSVAPGTMAPTGEAPVSGQPADAAKSIEIDMVAGETRTEAQAPTTPEDGSVAAPAPGTADAVAPAAPVDEGPVDIVAKLRSWLVPALGLTGLLLLVALGLAAVRGRGTQQQGLQLPNEFEAKGTRTAAVDSAPIASVTLDDEDLLPDAPDFREGPDQILEEVDVCLSFGNEERARELLVGALELYPANAGLHLKMLELLAQQGDRPGFEVAFSKLRTLGDGGAMEAANALLRELEEQDTAPTSVAAEELAPAELAPVTVAAAVVAAPSVVVEPPDFDLDFDLDLDFPAESVSDAAAIQTPPETSGNLEDFDLDLGESDRAISTDDLADGPAASTAESWQSAALDSDLDLFETGQEMATQIELAEAYVDMGDAEGAREILDYVLQGGDEAQKESARQLLARLG